MTNENPERKSFGRIAVNIAFLDVLIIGAAEKIAHNLVVAAVGCAAVDSIIIYKETRQNRDNSNF